MDKVAFFQMCDTVWNWWLTGIQAWLPRQINNQNNSSPKIILKPHDNQFEFLVLTKKGEEIDHKLDPLIETHAIEEIRQWLQKYNKFCKSFAIPPELILRRELTLPLSAKNNLLDILPFEVERHTPFFSDDIYFTYSDLQPKTDKKLSLILYVVPKRSVEPYIQHCEKIGFQPQSLLIPLSEKQNIEFSLNKSQVTASETNRLFAWLTLLSVLLLGIWLYQPAMLYEGKIEALTPELVTIKKQAELVKSLEQQNHLLVQKKDILNQQGEKRFSSFSFLSELSYVLPQDTWLEKSIIEGNQVSLFGYTDSISVLLEVLDKSSLLKQIVIKPHNRYASIDGKQYFELKAELVRDSGTDV